MANPWRTARGSPHVLTRTARPTSAQMKIVPVETQFVLDPLSAVSTAMEKASAQTLDNAVTKLRTTQSEMRKTDATAPVGLETSYQSALAISAT